LIERKIHLIRIEGQRFHDALQLACAPLRRVRSPAWAMPAPAVEDVFGVEQLVEDGRSAATGNAGDGQAM
jgi:hypothetical protein